MPKKKKGPNPTTKYPNWYLTVFPDKEPIPAAIKKDIHSHSSSNSYIKGVNGFNDNTVIHDYEKISFPVFLKDITTLKPASSSSDVNSVTASHPVPDLDDLVTIAFEQHTSSTAAEPTTSSSTSSTRLTPSTTAENDASTTTLQHNNNNNNIVISLTTPPTTSSTAFTSSLTARTSKPVPVPQAAASGPQGVGAIHSWMERTKKREKKKPEQQKQHHQQQLLKANAQVNLNVEEKFLTRELNALVQNNVKMVDNVQKQLELQKEMLRLVSNMRQAAKLL